MRSWEQKIRNKIKDVNYYVYEHYLNNKLFYIGKGSGERCFYYNDRSQIWKSIVNNKENEVLVKIKRTFKNENEALRFERYRIITMSKKYNLANIVYNYKLTEYKERIPKINKIPDKLYVNKKIEKSVGQKIETLENLIINLNNDNKNNYESKKVMLNINTKIKFIKDKIEYLRKTCHDNKLYLSEIIEKEKPSFSSNNLILAPVGSGKTTFIEKIIANKKDKILMLVSNTALKNSISPDDDVVKKTRGDRTYTTQNKRKYGDEKYEIYVMSYAEFGNKIRINNEFVKEINKIFCDEIHSLPEYQSYGDSASLALAMKLLFKKHDNIQIFYFTATNENLLKLNMKYPGVLNNVTTFNYLNHPEIRQYMALSEYKINHIEQIRSHLKARYKSFKYFDYKCFAYAKTITSQKRIAEIAEEEGFTPLVLWSVNNENKELLMTKEQLNARNELLIHGEIPAPYNFLIINSAMQEGWNLRDSKVKLAIMNTTNETEYTQALGRFRDDIDILIYRTNDNSDLTIDITIPEEYLNVSLTSKDKNEMCKHLNVLNINGDVSKWPAIKKIIASDGAYDVEEKTITMDGKRARVSIISSKIQV